MKPQIHDLSSDIYQWHNGLPVNFTGIRLPGGDVYTNEKDWGSICIQLFSSPKFIFGHTSISARHEISLVMPHAQAEGLFLLGAIRGNDIHVKLPTNTGLSSKQWMLFKGLPAMEVTVKAGNHHQLFSTWFKKPLYEEMASYFPDAQQWIANAVWGATLNNSVVEIDHEADEYIQQVLRCKLLPGWRPPYYEIRARDLLFKFLTISQQQNPVNYPYQKWEADKIYQAEHMIAEDISIHIRLPELAKMVGMNDQRFKAVFKMIFGMGAYEYLREKRLQKAVELLNQGELVKYAALETGWRVEDLIHAYKTRYGTTPGNRRKKNK